MMGQVMPAVVQGANPQRGSDNRQGADTATGGDAFGEELVRAKSLRARSGGTDGTASETRPAQAGNGPESGAAAADKGEAGNSETVSAADEGKARAASQSGENLENGVEGRHHAALKAILEQLEQANGSEAVTGDAEAMPEGQAEATPAKPESAGAPQTATPGDVMAALKALQQGMPAQPDGEAGEKAAAAAAAAHQSEPKTTVGQSTVPVLNAAAADRNAAAISPVASAAPERAERLRQGDTRADLTRIESAIARISKAFSGNGSETAAAAGNTQESIRHAEPLARLSAAERSDLAERVAARKPDAAQPVTDAKPVLSNTVQGQPVTVQAAPIQPGAAPDAVGRQVGEAVVRELESMSLTRLTVSEQATGPRTVKMLLLQLNPVELGKVSIRLHSIDGELRVSIRAESELAAKMIANDGELIASTLRSAGISAPDITVSGGRSEMTQYQSQDNAGRDHGGSRDAAHQDRNGTDRGSSQSQGWATPGRDAGQQTPDPGPGGRDQSAGGRVYI